MADTLAQLIDKVQIQLSDASGTLFTDAICTAAIRQALRDINHAAPQTATVLITAVADQKEYELSDEDPLATGIFDVLLQGTNEYDTRLAYDAYVEDSRHFFRLRSAQPGGNTLICRYTLPHTISGLDSATDSTLTDELNSIAVNGAIAWAAEIRATGTIESNNVAPNVAAQWLKAADVYHTLFKNELADYMRQAAAVGEPSTAAWNDPQHSDEYP